MPPHDSDAAAPTPDPRAVSDAPTTVERLLSRVVDVRRGELRAVVASCLYFFFLLSRYFILRPIRDAMGVAAGVSALPWLFAGTLSATLICNPLFSALVARFPVRRFIPLTYQFFAVNLLVFFLLLRGTAGTGSPATGAEVWIGRAFFVWTSVFNLFVVSVFWSFMADTFRSDQAKRLFGFIGVGGTLGSIAGSAVTAGLARLVGPVRLLLVSAVLLEIAIAIVMWFPAVDATPGPAAAMAADDASPRRGQRAAIGGGIWAGVRGVFRSRYLLGISAFLMLYTLGSTFLYFEQADILGKHFTTPAARTQVLAQMEFAAQTLTVVTQFFLTGRVIKRIGLAATLALMPALSVLGFVIMGSSAVLAVPTLAVFVAFSVLRRGTNFALTNPAMEVLFTVVTREEKYKAKSFIETFVYRTGDQVSAWIYAGLSALGLTLTGIAWPGALFSVVFLSLGVWLGHRQERLARAASA
jgi:AAA family ATP:ADP antiporter